MAARSRMRVAPGAIHAVGWMLGVRSAIRMRRMPSPYGGVPGVGAVRGARSAANQSDGDGDHDDGPDCLDMLWQNTLIYAGGGGMGQMQTASAPSADNRLGGYRLGGRG